MSLGFFGSKLFVFFLARLSLWPVFHVSLKRRLSVGKVPTPVGRSLWTSPFSLFTFETFLFPPFSARVFLEKIP